MLVNPAPPRRPARVPWALLGVVLAHLALGVLFVRATPLFETPDEGLHYAVIEWLRRGYGLPVQDPANPQAIYGQEGSQPPLYYVLAAALTAGLTSGDFEQVFVYNPHSRIGVPGTTHNVRWYRPAPPTATGETERVGRVVRWFSLALSAVTLSLVYALARQLRLSRGLALAATALAAFNPMLIFIHAAINNDNLLMLLSTATLVGLARWSRQPGWPGWRWAVGMGVLLGLAVLSKVSGLVLWPVVGLGLLARAIQLAGWRALFTPRWVGRLAAPFVVAGLVCGWWFVRNLMLYGELLGTRTMVAVVGARAVPVDALTLVAQEWYGFYLSFWGVFGVFTVLPHPAVQMVFHTVTLAALAGGVMVLARARGRAYMPALLALFVGLTLVGVLQWTWQTPASQGRLLFGAIAPLSLGLAVGLHTLNRRAPWLAAGALLACAVWIPVVDIAPRYTPPPFIDRAALPADLRPVQATVGDGLTLLGYLPDPTPHRPGEAVSATLFWQVTAPLTHDDTLALAVLGRNAEPLAVIDTWPGAGLRPMADLPVGAIFADRYTWPLPAEAHAPTRLQLSVGAWRGQPGARLPVQTGAAPAGEALFLTLGSLIPTTAPSPLTGPVTATFEGGLRLLGYTAEVQGAPEAPVLAFTPHWDTQAALPHDYTLFVHVLTAEGQQVAAADAPPLQGDWPTTLWPVGVPVADARSMALLPNLPPGRLTLRLGWYDPASGVRLPAYASTGARWPDEAVLLPVP